MITDQKLKRINELAKKQREEGLTDKEKEEQQNLREEYLAGVRQSFKSQLSSVKIVDPKGDDVTPSKLKKLKKEQKDK